jgi:hypothetical protein
MARASSASGLRDGPDEVIDVLEGHEGDDEAGAPLPQRKRGSVGHDRRLADLVRDGGACEEERRIEGDHLMTPGDQLPSVWSDVP